MMTRRFWMPVICSLIVTPIALLLGVASAGAGHGNYFAAMLLFPYTMLLTAAFDHIYLPFVLLAILQFPAYGVALGHAHQRRRVGRMAVTLLMAHVAAVAAVLLFASENFM